MNTNNPYFSPESIHLAEKVQTDLSEGKDIPLETLLKLLDDGIRQTRASIKTANKPSDVDYF